MVGWFWGAQDPCPLPPNFKLFPAFLINFFSVRFSPRSSLEPRRCKFSRSLPGARAVNAQDEIANGRRPFRWKRSLFGRSARHYARPMTGARGGQSDACSSQHRFIAGGAEKARYCFDDMNTKDAFERLDGDRAEIQSQRVPSGFSS